MSTEEVLAQGVTILGTAAQAAAPIVGIYNPAAGAALGLLAPLAEKFILTELGTMVIWKTDMTKEQMIEALNASKSAMWPEVPPIQ
jgi:hypothetical protein